MRIPGLFRITFVKCIGLSKVLHMDLRGFRRTYRRFRCDHRNWSCSWVLLAVGFCCFGLWWPSPSLVIVLASFFFDGQTRLDHWVGRDGRRFVGVSTKYPRFETSCMWSCYPLAVPELTPASDARRNAKKTAMPRNFPIRLRFIGHVRRSSSPSHQTDLCSAGSGAMILNTVSL